MEGRVVERKRDQTLEEGATRVIMTQGEVMNFHILFGDEGVLFAAHKEDWDVDPEADGQKEEKRESQERETGGERGLQIVSRQIVCGFRGVVNLQILLLAVIISLPLPFALE